MNGIFKKKEFFGKGVRLVNVWDLYRDEIIDLSSLDRVEVSDTERKQYRVNDGDVFFCRSSLKPEGVGWSCLARSIDEPTVFECHLIKATSDQRTLLPEFLNYYARTQFARSYVLAKATVTTMATIDQQAIEALPIILPDLPVQHTLVAEMQAARKARNEKLQRADALLASLDAYLLDTLGLTPPPEDSRVIFAVRAGVARKRFDPHFHLPSFQNILRALAGTQTQRLGNLAHFSRETWDRNAETSTVFRYIEINGVDIATGVATFSTIPTAEAPSRAQMVVRAGDILISLTRPHRGAIAQIGSELDGCIASTGFAILRGAAKDMVLSDYLWCALRMRLCLAQMLQRASGGNYPAITEDELADVLVPVPVLNVQQQIADEVRRRRAEARRLRAEAEADWTAAKRRFEEQLLGKPHEPIETNSESAQARLA